ncbi:MAG: 50S ribosomal protein L21 [bacterium]
MIAVLETGGKQYKVSPGSLIRVEKLAAKKGEEIVLDKVLMIKKDEESFHGNPWLAGARVVTEVTNQDRDRKIIVYKFKRRKNYHRKYGHRQSFTELKIKEIQFRRGG